MLKYKTKELMNEMDSLMEDCMKMMGGLDVIEGLDETSLKVMQRSIKLFNQSKELYVEYAEQMDNLNEKLDKVLFLLQEKNEA